MATAKKAGAELASTKEAGRAPGSSLPSSPNPATEFQEESEKDDDSRIDLDAMSSAMYSSFFTSDLDDDADDEDDEDDEPPAVVDPEKGSPPKDIADPNKPFETIEAKWIWLKDQEVATLAEAIQRANRRVLNNHETETRNIANAAGFWKADDKNSRTLLAAAKTLEDTLVVIKPKEQLALGFVINLMYEVMGHLDLPPHINANDNFRKIMDAACKPTGIEKVLEDIVDETKAEHTSQSDTDTAATKKRKTNG